MKETNHKKNNFWENNKYLFLAAGFAIAVMLLIFYCYNLVPFGNMTILRMDLYHQYGPLFAELYDRLTSHGSLLYSWESGLGGSFLGNFLNYLSSPLSFLILFFGHKNVTEAISLMIFLKAVLSSVTFAYYLKTSMHKNDASIAAFGVLYAFCGYFVAFYWNLMWIDAMYLFPLVILGIEKIIQQGKPSLYAISLALLFMTNYYMAYMVCIFSVLYFLTYYFSCHSVSSTFTVLEDGEKKPSLWKKLKNSIFLSSGVQFAFYSILSVLMVAVFILPLMEILSGSSATNGTAPTEFKKYFTVFDFLANHIAYSSPTIRSSGTDVLPNVYCGILTLLLVPLYLFCNQISTREKIANVALLGVLYFSFSVNYLNYFWHGFHFPNDLPYRFSFMYSFVLLQIAYKTLVHIRSFSGKQLLACGVGFLGFLILVEEITSKNITDLSLLISLLFAVGYVCILQAFKNEKFTVSTLSFLLACVVVSEVTLSNTNQYVMNQSKENYTADYDAFQAVKQKLDDYDKTPFYRMELTHLRTRMDPSWFGYNGVSVFSSMASETMSNMQSQLGMAGNFINSYTYHLQTPIYNAMFGLKYIVNNDSSVMNPEVYTELFSSDKFIAYQNEYALPIAFTASSNVQDFDASIFNKNPFEAQNDWFEKATGVSDVLTKIPISEIDYQNVIPFLPKDIQSGKLTFAKEFSESDGSFTLYFYPEKTQNVYLYLKSSKTGNADISAGISTKSVSTKDGYVIDLGRCYADELITVQIPILEKEERGTIDAYAYGLDLDAYKTGYEVLNRGALQITDFDETYIKGTILASNDQILYTSIPYDKNWTVYVDGVEVYSENVIQVSNSLLAVKIGSGSHTVEFKYSSKALKVGAGISITAIFLFLVLLVLKRKKPSPWNTLPQEKDADDVTHDDMLSDFLDLEVFVEDTKQN